jgi:hypothetical protein
LSFVANRFVLLVLAFGSGFFMLVKSNAVQVILDSERTNEQTNEQNKEQARCNF